MQRSVGWIHSILLFRTIEYDFSGSLGFHTFHFGCYPGSVHSETVSRYYCSSIR